MASVHVNSVQCTVLVDTGCSCAIISASRCRDWNRWHMTVETIDRMSHACCRVGVISILTEVEVIILRWMHWWCVTSLWGYGLLIGIDTIRELGSIEKCSLGENVNYVQLSWLWNRTSVLFLTMKMDSEVEMDKKQSARSIAWHCCRIYSVQLEQSCICNGVRHG